MGASSGTRRAGRTPCAPATYDPAAGRFLSQDPDPGHLPDPVSLHRYLYTRNDPVNRIDPTGKDDLGEEVEGEGIRTQLVATDAGVGVAEGADGISEVGNATEQITAEQVFAARLTDTGVDGAECLDDAGILGEGPVQHFTNAEGVEGITGINPDDLEIGQTVRVPKLSSGQGANDFKAESQGDIFVTEVGPDASPGQLNQIGVFGDKQDFVIQFSRESTFADGTKINPLFPSRSIFGLPKGTTLDASDYIYTVTRLR